MAIPAEVTALPFASINVGNAVAALAFTLAVQQFLRPIHRFRLQTRRLNTTVFYFIIFISAGLVLVGNVIRTFDFWYFTAVEAIPVFELLGGAGFIVAYLLLALSTLRPARLTERNGREFAKGALEKLGQRNADEYLAVFRDIEPNTEKLLVLAQFNEVLFRGRPRGSPPLKLEDLAPKIRKKAKASNDAGMLLLFLADRELCRTLVTREPHAVLRMIRTIKSKALASRQAKPFIQQVAKQALLSDDSILARELEGRAGLGATQDFLTNMFGDAFILETYHPYDDMSYPGATLGEPLAKRIAASVKSSTPALLAMSYQGGLSSQRDVQSMLEWASGQFGSRSEELPGLSSMYITNCVEQLVKDAREHLSTMTVEDRTWLYQTSDEDYGSNIAACIAEIAYNHLESVSNEFPGPKDRNWNNGLSVFTELFESIGKQPLGMDPIQQRVAIKIVEKVKQNLKGYFPTVLRLVLMMVGPQQTKDVQSGTAFAILRDAVYAELKNLTRTYHHTRATLEQFLPDYVSFDDNTGALIFTFPNSGEEVVTDVRSLQLEPADLTNSALFIESDREGSGG